MQLPSEQLMSANVREVAASTFGPSVDGDFLNHGQFDKSVDAYVRSSLSSAPAAALDYITTTLYPPIYNGTGALLHGQDVPYTYYDPGAASRNGDAGFNEMAALMLQDYITSFAAKGMPDSAMDRLPRFAMYGVNAGVVELTQRGVGVQADPGGE
ncbi:hypothetical protein B0J12DRAFT_746536 [Macrophomina phaseolina]|uniref:Carboxylesterase type B domain-containing protein n=1 Tax=Macrophomina phaseolina TaxID=35725 RepID=A0ABQ8FS82_9PEZI|nr:hypothetical protein B0J12DRAFT_746536 [Macrophomina phaseolina]